MKKLIALVLMVALIMSVSITAFAEEESYTSAWDKAVDVMTSTYDGLEETIESDYEDCEFISKGELVNGHHSIEFTFVAFDGEKYDQLTYTMYNYTYSETIVMVVDAIVLDDDFQSTDITDGAAMDWTYNQFLASEIDIF